VSGKVKSHTMQRPLAQGITVSNSSLIWTKLDVIISLRFFGQLISKPIVAAKQRLLRDALSRLPISFHERFSNVVWNCIFIIYLGFYFTPIFHCYFIDFVLPP